MGNNVPYGKIAIGENSTRKSYGYPISTHAEIDAIGKIYMQSKMRTKKRPIHVDLLVVRVSKTGQLGSSRPCYNCLLSMEKTSFLKIHNVYYSTNDKTIVKEKFTSMLKSEKTHLSVGFRKNFVI